MKNTYSPIQKTALAYLFMLLVHQSAYCQSSEVQSNSQLYEDDQYNPKGMNYELRRPISYFYNRLAYKFDVNPYTSHLLTTSRTCSSELGPHCQFINAKGLMSDYEIPKSVEVPKNFVNLQTALTMSVEQSRKLAFQIENNNQDIFMISNQIHKKYDEYIQQIIKNDMFQERDLHHFPQKIVEIKEVKTGQQQKPQQPSGNKAQNNQQTHQQTQSNN